MNRPYPHPAECVCTGCEMVREGNRMLRDREPSDETPRWFAALRTPTLTGVVTYKGVNVDEVIAAAQAVVADWKVDGIAADSLLRKLEEVLPK